MDSCSNHCIGFRFSQVHQSLTSRTTAVPLLLRRSSGDLRLLCKKRARFKRRFRSLVQVNSSFLPPPFDGSVPIESFAPTVAGVASGLAAYLTSRFFGKSMGSSGGDKKRDDDVIGEWVLFTSPTPFNRFVLLRCSLLSFDVGAGDGELLEGLNDRLVKEERHFVRLDTGKIPAAERDGGIAEETALEYQRVCIKTEDGGVVSLDWPATLELREERGLDTTVILVPGTPDGSMNEGVRSFVREALRRGVFPVVMNPRGCAGSPLTTARLFTAADSDDISTAVRFITKARPWTTLMGVGWGYGANMLTKHLAEVGERTPLTAAVCIDNPFDLEEITRTSPYHNTLDQHLTRGLVEILRSNKELFQGRAKGFDVGKALSSKSVRDFEKAISMVTYGCESVEEFYSKSSTRSRIREVKIPVLFIQNDDVVPLFSIPRGAIADNPFTSLLLCSLSPSSVIAGGTAAVSWCHHLAIEWLTAVELGLLKGRHPLLKDIDVTVNPSKGLALMETRVSEKSDNAKKLLEVTLGKTINGHHIDPIMETLEDSAIASNFTLRSGTYLDENVKINDRSHGPEDSGVSKGGPLEVELVEDEMSSGEESERGQILQTAQVVMNMLDVTMPGMLKAKEKKKVLDAVDQGETIMKALEDAVPEDVRGKLTTAVTAILNAPGTKLKFEKLNLPNVTPGYKPKTQEPSKGPLNAVGQQDPHSPDQSTKKTDDLVSGSNNIPGGSDNFAGGVGTELNPSEASQIYGDSGKSQPFNTHQGDSSVPAKKVNDESGSNHGNDESSTKEKVNAADVAEKASEPGVKAGSSSQGKPSGTEDVISDGNKVDQDAVISQQHRKEETVNKNEDKAVESASDQNKVASISKEEDAGPGPPSESEPVGKEENDNQKKETKNLQPLTDQTKPAVQEPIQPTFSVSQAFDALTGIDDSTQVAVNSVFGVLENMLSQLEEGSKEDDEVTGEKKLKDEKISSPSELQTPDNRVAEDNMLSHGSDDVSGLHESRKGSTHKATTGLLKGKNLVRNKPDVGDYDEHLPKISSERHPNLVENSSSCGYFQDLSDEQTVTQLDLDTTTALLLDYYPEEGQWKLLEQLPENFEESVNSLVASGDNNGRVHSPSSANDGENIIEPSYVILNNGQDLELTEKRDAVDNPEDDLDNIEEGCKELMRLVKVIVLDSLNVEVQRRMSSSGLRQIESQLNKDMEKVADAVSLVVKDVEHTSGFKYKNTKANIRTEKICELHGETVIRAISLTVQETRFLRQVLPVGVVVGCILAALRKYFDVSTVCDDAKREVVTRKVNQYRKKDEQKSGLDNNMNQTSKWNGSRIKKGVESGLQNIKNDQVMVGAVTAALGASAMLVQQQDSPKGGQNVGIMSKSLKEQGGQQKEPDKLDQSNMVASLAEKAMSIAGPVVPTKESGEVDQERLVAMLADLGQKGGILKLVGKFALLWGGIRGAMSLTDRLISFLQVAEWPLLKRVIGFMGMVLVLWSPIVVPLLPTLVQSWSTSNPSKTAELASIIGLYVAVFILVMLWGKRVREYENPLRQYGLDFSSSPNKKIQDFLKGLAGGIVLVLLVQSVNAMIGAAVFSWPPHLPSSFDAVKWVKGYGQLLMLIVRGFTTATCVVLVEELLFRSWLPEEIATDLGSHQSVIISGLAFALFQRSLRAIPGLWLLSLALSGVRQRIQGSLIVPIGLRTGIMASSFILQTGQFLVYNPSFPVWIAGTCPLQPFSGVVGVAFALALALVLHPRQSPESKKQKQS